MREILQKAFSFHKTKIRKTLRILNKKIVFWNYRYMIREIYRYQNFQRLSKNLKNQGITLPADAIGLIEESEIVKVPLKEIRRKWNGKLLTLADCSPFKYLQTRDKQIYSDYIQKHIDLGVLPADADKTPERFENLEKSMNEKGYDPALCVVVLNKDNVIIDGQHRCCILLYKFGPDYRVTAIREKQR
mgnify:CR=1 FL=1